MREEKENIYEIKDNAICFALSQGWLAPVGAHGDFTIYRGGGYCFHSLIGPQRQEPAEAEPGAAENLFVESKPREAAEMHLADALATLLALPETSLPEGFERHESGNYGQDDDDEGSHRPNYSFARDDEEDDLWQHW